MCSKNDLESMRWFLQINKLENEVQPKPKPSRKKKIIKKRTMINKIVKEGTNRKSKQPRVALVTPGGLLKLTNF